MDSQEKIRLEDIKLKIEEIEKLAVELNELGRCIPVVEKNAQILLNTTYVLKFGIPDIAEFNRI